MWYKTGTINLTSNSPTVTGTGTAWADAKFGIMPGMILLAPDNKFYEIKQVNSNTSLTLNSNYAGATASGQSYAIITTYEGDISQFSARFAAMLTFFQGSRNDTVTWFTGTGDMTFTKDDGTKLTVPTLAKVQADYLSRTVTADQIVAGPVRFTYATRLSTTSQPDFQPANQGAWVAWNRHPTAADAYSGATDFITHRGGGQGGWNFWNSNGTTTSLAAKISPSGLLTVNNTINGKNELSLQALTPGANVVTRFKDYDGGEQGAIYVQPTGTMNFRWNGTAYTMQGRSDGLISIPYGHLFATSMSTEALIEKLETIGAAPLHFRGADSASFNSPSNYSIGTWYGFSVVPTIGAGLAEGVEKGKPVFFINARTGTAHVLKNMYVGTSPVIKKGDHGIGSVNSGGVFDFTKLSSPAGFYRGVESQGGAPAGGSSMAGMSVSVSGAYTGHIYTAHGSTPGTIKLYTGWTRANGTIDFVSMWHNGNTTVDANGFLKKASPIARLANNPEEMADEYLDGFTLSGLVAVNSEAEGVTAQRVSTGVYKVTGSLGFATKGWNIEVPQDVNGNRLCFVATEVDDEGTITVNVSKRRFDIDTAAVVAGDPMDIPEGRWIDLRLEMPPVAEESDVNIDEPESEPNENEGEVMAE